MGKGFFDKHGITVKGVLWVYKTLTQMPAGNALIIGHVGDTRPPKAFDAAFDEVRAAECETAKKVGI